ncbi:MAG: DUF2271 domain-containing protein [Verrucomicrobiales bacterium]|nr:DUF2271 domain-containing protein [Verrucomicrobiales bacterium]
MATTLDRRVGVAFVSLAALLAAGRVSRSASAAEQVVFRHENVLGTSLELRVRTASMETASAVEAKVLSEMDRLNGIFSTYQAGTELMRWQGTRGEPVRLSPELFAVLTLSDQWREASGGVFNPAVETLSRVWKGATTRGEVPTATEMQSALQLVSAKSWSLDRAAGTGTRLSEAPLSLNAIAKGWIVEHAGTKTIAGVSGLESVVLNVGGDLRHWGAVPERIEIADPRADAENAPRTTAVTLRDQALATSGGYRRHYLVGGKRYSHILDPRTGQSASEVLGASVVAPDSVTADVLATVLNLIPASEVRLSAEQQRSVHWLVMDREGRVTHSPGWSTVEPAAGVSMPGTGTAPAPLAVAAVTPPSAAARKAIPGGASGATVAGGEIWPKGYELRVDFELNQPEGGRYARPYVAAWVEDAEGYPVRTLALWLLQGEKGKRWLPDLRRWYRSDQMRALVDTQDLVATVSSATRSPGKYGLVWDGLDDHGKPVKAGRYHVFLEASREHGTYQLLRHEWTVGPQPMRVEMPANLEIKRCTFEYAKRNTR